MKTIRLIIDCIQKTWRQYKDLNQLCNIINDIIPRSLKKVRVDLVFVSYFEADEYLKKGYTIAKEEDENAASGWVYLELTEMKTI